jgi:hypothetical protein
MLGLCPQIERGRPRSLPAVTKNQKSASGTLSWSRTVGRNSEAYCAMDVRATGVTADYATLIRPAGCGPLRLKRSYLNSACRESGGGGFAADCTADRRLDGGLHASPRYISPSR